MARRILLIDDELRDLAWLVTWLKHRGYEVDVASNEQTARKALREVADGDREYAAAIVDVMLATHDIEDFREADEKFFEESTDTGIRLCRYAREELGLSEAKLPLACMSVREDKELKMAIKAIGVPRYNRDPEADEGTSITDWLTRKLPE